jgi:hypothetical protein
MRVGPVHLAQRTRAFHPAPATLEDRPARGRPEPTAILERCPEPAILPAPIPLALPARPSNAPTPARARPTGRADGLARVPRAVPGECPRPAESRGERGGALLP